MKKLITTLTPDQEALIRVYRKKWHTIAHSTQPINRQKATEAIQLAYNLMGDPNPEIVFVKAPMQLLTLYLVSFGSDGKAKMTMVIVTFSEIDGNF